MKNLLTFLGIISACFFTSLTAQTNVFTGLKAYYPCTGNMQDSSGYGHHGTLLHGATFTTDRFGNPNSALYLDGVDDYVELISSAAMRPSDFPMTICAWVKPSSSLVSTGIVFANTEMDLQYGGQWLQVNTIIPDQTSSNYGTANNSTSASSRRAKRAQGIICDDDWHFIGTVIHGLNDITLKIDCKEYPSYYSGTLAGTFTYTTTQKGNIGRLHIISQAAEYYKGAIDEVRFYDRALTNVELALLCSAGPTSVKTPSFNDYLSCYFTNEDNQLVISADPSAKTETLKIRISNMLGQVVWEQNALSSSNFEGRYTLDNLALGFYVLTVENGKNKISQKFIKY
ncbi:MAG: LamG-like jellyroll fold domain-containing protein [Bacteroidia bacterium]